VRGTDSGRPHLSFFSPTARVTLRARAAAAPPKAWVQEVAELAKAGLEGASARRGGVAGGAGRRRPTLDTGGIGPPGQGAGRAGARCMLGFPLRVAVGLLFLYLRERGSERE